MKHICLILSAIAAICGTAFGQAIRPISYNASNNVVVGSTNTNPFTFSNSFAWSTNTLAGATRTNLSLGWSALTNTNAATALIGYTTNGSVVANTGALTFTNSVKFGDDLLLSNNTFFFGTNARWSPEDNSFSAALAFDGTNVIADTRANLGFSTNLNTLWTATNASNARSAVGLGATNAASFQSVITEVMAVGSGTNSYFSADVNMVETALPIEFANNSAAATRTNLGLPLAALTNTSNDTMMRALSGSTNTNHPYSGSISVTGTNNTNTLVFSNGILQSVQ